MRIRPMQVEDIEAVYALGKNREEFSTPSGSFWSKEQLGKWCENPNDILLIVEDAEKIVGFSLYAVHVPTGKVTWENLYVNPSVRNQGIGSALIQEAHERLKEKGYSYVALQDNSNDQEGFAKYLERFGFKTGEKVLWIDQFLI